MYILYYPPLTAYTTLACRQQLMILKTTNANLARQLNEQHGECEALKAECDVERKRNARLEDIFRYVSMYMYASQWEDW